MSEKNGLTEATVNWLNLIAVKTCCFDCQNEGILPRSFWRRQSFAASFATSPPVRRLVFRKEAITVAIVAIESTGRSIEFLPGDFSITVFVQSFYEAGGLAALCFALFAF